MSGMNTFSLSVSQQVGESKLLLQTNTIGTLYHLTHQGLYRQTGKYILRTRGLRKKNCHSIMSFNDSKRKNDHLRWYDLMVTTILMVNPKTKISPVFFTTTWARLFKRKIFSISTLLKKKRNQTKKKQKKKNNSSSKKTKDNSFFHCHEITSYSSFELLAFKQSVSESLPQLASNSVCQ